MSNHSALDGIRVLELTKGFSGAMAAKQFADYGAEVVMIEGHDGHPLRKMGPFPDNQEDVNFSGSFIYTSTNKRSITLNVFDKNDFDKLFLKKFISQSLRSPCLVLLVE